MPNAPQSTKSSPLDGFVVYKAPEGLSEPQVQDKTQWPSDFALEPLTAPKLRVGDCLLVTSFNESLFVGTVQGSPQGHPYFRSRCGSLWGVLQFDKERQGWVCAGLFIQSAVLP